MNKKPHKGTVEWYRYVDRENMKLRSKLLKHTTRKKNETPRQLLQRINKIYTIRKIQQ